MHGHAVRVIYVAILEHHAQAVAATGERQIVERRHALHVRQAAQILQVCLHRRLVLIALGESEAANREQTVDLDAARSLDFVDALLHDVHGIGEHRECDCDLQRHEHGPRAFAQQCDESGTDLQIHGGNSRSTIGSSGRRLAQHGRCARPDRCPRGTS
jgi:hypothetical protein